VGWVTLRPTAVHCVRTKPAACGWLRLSSYNCADQSSIVIQSLPSESAVHQRRATRRCAVVDKKWAVWQSGGSLLETYPRVASGLTAALRPADVVDIAAGAADVPVVETKIDGERLPCFGPTRPLRAVGPGTRIRQSPTPPASSPRRRRSTRPRSGSADHDVWVACGFAHPNIFTRSQLNDPFAP
jgi:hypothetical protein